jgi:hypothetical protein
MQQYEAFDRVSALDFEVPNPYVNHGPMACEALRTLRFDSIGFRKAVELAAACDGRDLTISWSRAVNENRVRQALTLTCRHPRGAHFPT